MGVLHPCRCTDGGEIWHGGGDGPLRAKFHPHRCNDKGVGPPKLKFLLRFYRNVEYKRPARAYPLRGFHKICRLCTSFQDALGVKIWLDLLKGLWSYGGLNLRGSGCPQIFSAPKQRNYASDPKRFRGARTCSRSSITTPSLVRDRISPAAGAEEKRCFFVCLFVTLSWCGSGADR